MARVLFGRKQAYVLVARVAAVDDRVQTLVVELSAVDERKETVRRFRSQKTV